MANDPPTHLPGPPDRRFAAYLFDLDGTVTLGDALLPAAGETITRLRDEGRRTLFLSNNPTRTAAEYAARLTRLGLPPGRCLMVGDRLETDVLFGLNAGMAAALALTGATSEAEAIASGIRPTYVLRRLDELIL